MFQFCRQQLNPVSDGGIGNVPPIAPSLHAALTTTPAVPVQDTPVELRPRQVSVCLGANALYVYNPTINAETLGFIPSLEVNILNIKVDDGAKIGFGGHLLYLSNENVYGSLRGSYYLPLSQRFALITSVGIGLGNFSISNIRPYTSADSNRPSHTALFGVELGANFIYSLSRYLGLYANIGTSLGVPTLGVFGGLGVQTMIPF